MVCPGSWLKEQGRPRIIGSGGSADEGTLAHDIGAQCLQYNHDPVTALGKEWNNTTRDDGSIIEPTIVTQEMVNGVTAYVNHCRSLYGSDGGQGGVESSGQLDFPGGIVLTGTMDHWYWDAHGLHISDLKYGFGWVYPEENWQLVSYAVMVWKMKMNGHLPPMVHLHIVQPRAFGRAGGPVYTWSFNGELLRNYHNILQNTLSEAVQPNARLNSGDHCRYCRYILNCDVNRRAAGQALDVSGLSNDHDLEPIDVSLELSEAQAAMTRLKHRVTALEQHGIALAQQGQTPPGYEVRDTWTKGATWDIPDPLAAGDEMGVNLRAEPKPLTPAQAIKAGLITKEMAGYMSSKKVTGKTLKQTNMDAIRRIVNG